MPARPAIRLFTAAPLSAGAEIPLTEGQAHYLHAVMRMAAGDEIALFNGQDGEWTATLTETGKRRATARADRLLRPQTDEPRPGPWLLFAPLKKDATDMVVEKATELGASRLVPVLTRYTNAARVNTERLSANAVEAAEQCERLSVPAVAEPEKLDRLLDGWTPSRHLLVMDETGAGRDVAGVLADLPAGADAAVLIGPEGGFEKSELELLHRYPFVIRVTLGPRILRAETAALAALTCWQALRGDWQGRPAFRAG